MLISLGVDHRRAGLPVRERFRVSDQHLAVAYRALRRWHGRALWLSTCNRAEVVAWVPTGDARRARELVAALVRRLAPRASAAQEFLALAQVRLGVEAARHLLRIAAGLESRVRGDAQILGQVRAAVRLAESQGVLGSELQRVFQAALRVGRRVRLESDLVRRRPSAGTVAGSAIARCLRDLAGRPILIVGAGKTAAAAATRLAALGADRLTVVNRTEEHAWPLALEAGATVAPFSELLHRLARSDAAVFATGADRPLVELEPLESARFVTETRGQPLLLLDLSLPRNVDPRVTRLPGVSLLDLDGLGAGPDEVPALADLIIAERIVGEELDRRLSWLGDTGQRRLPIPR